MTHGRLSSLNIEYVIQRELNFSNLVKNFAAQKARKVTVCELVLCFILPHLIYEFLIYCSRTGIVIFCVCIFFSVCLSTCYISYHTRILLEYEVTNMVIRSLLFVFCIFRVIIKELLNEGSNMDRNIAESSN